MWHLNGIVSKMLKQGAVIVVPLSVDIKIFPFDGSHEFVYIPVAFER